MEGKLILARTFIAAQRNFGDDVPRHRPRSSEGKPSPRQRGTVPSDTTQLQHPCRQTSFPTSLHTMANDLNSATNARLARKTFEVAIKRCSAA